MTAATALLSLAVAACGGGGGAPPAPGGTAPPTQGTERLTISIPHAATSSGRMRAPRYVSTATQSVKLFAPGGVATAVTLTSVNPNCAQTSSALVCTVDFSIPLGTTTVTVSTYASTDGSGTPLSTQTLTITAVAGRLNVLDLTLNAVVSRVRLTAAAGGSPHVTQGTAVSIGLVVTVLDAAGATIVGPGAYVDAAGNPLAIALSDSDTSGATSVAPKTFNAPADGNSATLTYNGAQIPSFTITASAPGLAPFPMTVLVNRSQQTVYAGITTCDAGSDGITINGYAPAPSGTTMLGAQVGSFAANFGSSIAATRQGDVFVGVGQVIDRYAPGATGSSAPAAVITLPASVSNAGGPMAVDSAGGLWLAAILNGDRPPLTPEVLHYPPNASGSAPPDRVVTGVAGVAFPLDTITGVSVDSHDNLYVSNYNTQRISVLPPTANGNDTTPIASYPNGPRITVDQHTDTVWAYPVNVYAGGTTTAPAPGATPVSTSGIVAYPNGSSTPSRVLYGAEKPYTQHGGTPGIMQPSSVGIDDAGNLYAVYTGISIPCFVYEFYVFAPSENGLVPQRSSVLPGAFTVFVPPFSTPSSPSSHRRGLFDGRS